MVHPTRAIESALQVFRQGEFVNFKKNSHVAATWSALLTLRSVVFRCSAHA
jgi:hypothetical protein